VGKGSAESWTVSERNSLVLTPILQRFWSHAVPGTHSRRRAGGGAGDRGSSSWIQGEPNFIVSSVKKQNLNPSYWHIWCTQNYLKINRIENVYPRYWVVEIFFKILTLNIIYLIVSSLQILGINKLIIFLTFSISRYVIKFFFFWHLRIYN